MSHPLIGSMAGVMDERHVGLICRADPLCLVSFQVKHDELTTKAAGLRDAHELGVHGYRHVSTDTTIWNYARRFTKQGRSMMGRR